MRGGLCAARGGFAAAPGAAVVDHATRMHRAVPATVGAGAAASSPVRRIHKLDSAVTPGGPHWSAPPR
eukprot:366275-Chlamydomonas_euryale.AAC.2